jgi:endoglucanase Acf2
LLPHQQLNLDPSKVLFDIETLRGRQKFLEIQEGIQFQIKSNPIVDKLEIKPQLLLDYTPKLKQILLQDFESLGDLSEGSYFSGKQLSKIAVLLEISKELGEKEIATKLQDRLNSGLKDWFEYSGLGDKRYFEYDKKIGGLIAYKPEFGLEEYNDHHFQFGYFVHASSILSKYDSEFFENYSKFVNFLVDDFANFNRNDKFLPYSRVFDFYEGHSWASGKQPFEDGNNQESSSEAVNAWYSVWLWAQRTNNNQLESFASYLYNMEANSALEYYLKPIKSMPSAGILWGGKVDYTTFFSSDELPTRGIQYLPFTPGSIYLKNSKSQGLNFQNKENDTWVDINLMYQGMWEGLNVADKNSLDKVKVDDGNSRANMYYWLLYWEGKK